MAEIYPPGDNEIEKHSFYAQVAAAINANTEALSRVFKVLAPLEQFQTRALVVVSLLVMVLGGLNGWLLYAFNRALDAEDKRTALLERHDRQLEFHDALLKQQQPITDQLSAIKSRLNRMEDQILTLEVKTQGKR